MSIKKDIIANYFGVIIVALTPILALPWYMEALGPKQFGLIGFITMLQAVLGLLDAGIGQALVREVAIRFGATSQSHFKTAKLLFGFERIYWLFAIAVGAATWILAGLVATHWLNLGTLPLTDGQMAVEGAAVLFAAQFPGSVYRSFLVGAQAQVVLNAIMIVSALLRHVGAVLAVLMWPSLFTYIMWHASIALLDTLVRRYLAWRTLSVKRSELCWDSTELRPVWRIVVGMSGAVLLGALTIQMDKIVLSRMASIEQFGYYTVASNLATGVLMLIAPLMNAVMPRAVHSHSNPDALRRLNLRLLGFIGSLVLIGTLIYFVFGRWLLIVWLKNPSAVQTIYPLLSMLLIGTAFNAFYNIGYMNWIIQEKIFRVLQVNILGLLLSFAIIPSMIVWQGIIGATIGWVTINLIGLIISLEWLKNRHYEK